MVKALGFGGLPIMLSVGAGLFTRSLRNVRSLDLGFDAEHTLVATIDFSGTSFKQPEIERLFETAAQRLRHADNVENTAIAGSVPFSWIPRTTSS